MTFYDLHVLNAHGYVDADPQVLADLARVYLDVYALASCGQSEDDSSPIALTAIMLAVRNACAGGTLTVAGRLLRSQWRGVKQASDGKFGSQECLGKWAATTRPPGSFALRQASLILAAPSPVADFTEGSCRWLGVSAQNALHARNPEKYPLDAMGVIAARKSEGLRCVTVPGVPRTVFFTKRQVQP